MILIYRHEPLSKQFVASMMIFCYLEVTTPAEIACGNNGQGLFIKRKLIYVPLKWGTIHAGVLLDIATVSNKNLAHPNHLRPMEVCLNI